jgi:hypothetical protein
MFIHISPSDILDQIYYTINLIVWYNMYCLSGLSKKRINKDPTLDFISIEEILSNYVSIKSDEH